MALREGSHGSILNGNYAATWVTSEWKSTQYRSGVALRKELLETCNLHTILDCPGGTFQGDTGLIGIVLISTQK